MDLLIDEWIPVRTKQSNTSEWISLQHLLTSDTQYQLSMPRDDLEMAALQLITSITQVLWMPKNLDALKQRLAKPLGLEEYVDGIEPVKRWFQLDHTDHPFMQIRGVQAKDMTPMDKLLAGLTGATNSCFVNEPGLAQALCGSCASVALFNQAANAPSFGGGFKAGLRGGSPITTLVQGLHLRQTVWMNVLVADQYETEQLDLKLQPPTWVEPIREKSEIPALGVGLFRGLLWQPAHIELCPPKEGNCACCGRQALPVYTGFRKAKFNYTVSGLWTHPHSPRLLVAKKGKVEKKYAAFTTAAPTWTRLISLVVERELEKGVKEGSEPADVVVQARQLLGKNRDKLRLAVGGYRNNQASILERRHEMLELGVGWQGSQQKIKELVETGLGYKTALRKALYVFSSGVKEVKGAGIALQESGECLFFSRSESIMQFAIADAEFDNPALFFQDLQRLRGQLSSLCHTLFEQETRPYLNDPQLIHTLAVARRTLLKHLKELMPAD